MLAIEPFRERTRAWSIGPNLGEIAVLKNAVLNEHLGREVGHSLFPPKILPCCSRVCTLLQLQQ